MNFRKHHLTSSGKGKDISLDAKTFCSLYCIIPFQGSTTGPLPYAIFITKILKHFGISTDGETKVALNLCESKIDVEVVRKMGFSIDPIDRRTYKHVTDRPTAPTAQPKPTNPNPPEFHAQSTSSAAMPSNQIIMGELFSLRGYITNLMDALDAQNQQIQYELHRISSRLISMDVHFV
ncbi:hypothetical protein Lal_00043047 [Lupinus albus]|nr:hypothetical protein Lal_00043047 [Lupinus albus]